MSLVNSMINQVGREMGRDAYRSVKNAMLSSKNKNIVDNFSLLVQVKNFDVSPYEAVTMRNLNKLVDSVTTNINPRSFDWEDVFLELDNLIDSLKVSLKSSDHVGELEKLDNNVLVGYKISEQVHKNFINRLIEEHKTKIQEHESRNGLTSLLLTFVGMNAFYTAEKGNRTFLGVFGIIWFGLGLAAFFALLFKSEPLTMPHLLGAIIAGLFCMLPTLILAGFRGISSKVDYKSNKEKLASLEKYYSLNF